MYGPGLHHAGPTLLDKYTRCVAAAARSGWISQAADMALAAAVVVG